MLNLSSVWLHEGGGQIAVLPVHPEGGAVPQLCPRALHETVQLCKSRTYRCGSYHRRGCQGGHPLPSDWGSHFSCDSLWKYHRAYSRLSRLSYHQLGDTSNGCKSMA